MGPIVALRDDSSSRVNSVAIGGIADLSERLVQTNSVENDPTATLAVHCGNVFDARFEPYHSTRLSRYNAGP
jgi:hypothetical protein